MKTARSPALAEGVLNASSANAHRRLVAAVFSPLAELHERVAHRIALELESPKHDSVPWGGGLRIGGD